MFYCPGNPLEKTRKRNFQRRTGLSPAGGEGSVWLTSAGELVRRVCLGAWEKRFTEDRSCRRAQLLWVPLAHSVPGAPGRLPLECRQPSSVLTPHPRPGPRSRLVLPEQHIHFVRLGQWKVGSAS